jgi:molecular chaperone HtpG
MSVEAQKEDMQFQTEVSQLLHLMIHSLYSNKEIFLRELVSNASDACDKMRFEALSDDSIYEGDSELKIQIEFDKDAKTLSIRDNGIGMSRDEVIENIGTIARSGTAEFLKNLTGDQAKDSHLIGQFGVGFYSSFIVADKVTLRTRKAGTGTAASDAVQWVSEGKDNFSIENIEKESRGTEVVLHLRDDAEEFMNSWQLRSIITRYSDHVPWPIEMHKEDEEGKVTDEWEQVNKASALWRLPKKDVSDEEYKEFYKHVGHDFEDPLAWTHNRVEGNLEYYSLLYIPAKAPFDLWERDQTHGVKLYVQRVFIMDDTEHLMPRYLRFVRGVIDSSDLPLNVSREILQSNRVIDSIRSGSVKKVLGLMETMAKDDAENYQKFWDQFGKVLKEGPGEDFANREQVAKLMRFATTAEDSEIQNVSLVDYVSRMKEGQKKIYYITADNFSAARNSPNLEVFRKKDIEVLLLTDRVDEWLVSNLTEFDGKPLQSVAKGELDLDEIETEEEKKEHEKQEKEAEGLINKIKEALGEQVSDVRVSHRLTQSPASIILNEHDMALYMQNLMKQAGQEIPGSKPILEINPGHPVIQRLDQEEDNTKVKDWSEILLDQAVLAEGGQLEDPARFVSRLNGLMMELAG